MNATCDMREVFVTQLLLVYAAVVAKSLKEWCTPVQKGVKYVSQHVSREWKASRIVALVETVWRIAAG